MIASRVSIAPSTTATRAGTDFVPVQRRPMASQPQTTATGPSTIPRTKSPAIAQTRPMIPSDARSGPVRDPVRPRERGACAWYVRSPPSSPPELVGLGRCFGYPRFPRSIARAASIARGSPSSLPDLERPRPVRRFGLPGTAAGIGLELPGLRALRGLVRGHGTAGSIGEGRRAAPLRQRDATLDVDPGQLIAVPLPLNPVLLHRHNSPAAQPPSARWRRRGGEAGSEATAASAAAATVMGMDARMCFQPPVSYRPVAFATDHLPDTLARKIWFREGSPGDVTRIKRKSDSSRGFPHKGGFSALSTA